MAFDLVHYTFLIVLLLATTHHQVLARNPVAVPSTGSDGSRAVSDNFCFKFRVHVINGFSNNNQPLLLHCWSLDDDLGNHTMYIGGDFNFHFRLQIFGGKTIFTCTFKWGAKHQEFPVFRDAVEADTCCVDGNTCYWRTQDDGVYFSVDNQSWIKTYDWLQ